jgi:hypothetical protein
MESNYVYLYTKKILYLMIFLILREYKYIIIDLFITKYVISEGFYLIIYIPKISYMYFDFSTKISGAWGGATSRTVPGSNPGGVTGFFSDTFPSDRTMALGSIQPLAKNEYQEYSC